MNDSNPTPIKSSRIVDLVYAEIKNQILTGKLQPGERIIQEHITSQLQVSRTPIREALQRLTSEGLVVNKPFYGAVVFQASMKELQEIYKIRIMIECYAAQKALDYITNEDIENLARINNETRNNLHHIPACMVGDRKFHQYMCQISVSDYTMQILNGLWDKCDPYKSMYMVTEENREHMVNEHDNIVACLQSADSFGLSQAIGGHLNDVVKKISSRHAFEG